MAIDERQTVEGDEPSSVRLSYRDADGKHHDCELKQRRIILGRKGKRHVDVDLEFDLSVSRQHAQVFFEDGRWWVEDLDSRGGTRLRGEDLGGKGRAAIGRLETIEVGRTLVEVELLDESGDEVAADGATIVTTVSAKGTLFVPSGPQSRDDKRLRLLYELPLVFAAERGTSALCHRIVELLVDVIPQADAGTLLTCDSRGGLELQAWFPEEQRPQYSRSLARSSIEKKEGFIWEIGQGGDDTPSLFSQSGGMYAPLIWEDQTLGALSVTCGNPGAGFGEDDNKLMVSVARYAAMALANLKLRAEQKRSAKMRATLERVIGPDLAKQFSDSSQRPKLGGKRSEVTILCSDLRHFTKMSQAMEPDDVADFLNEIFGRLIPIVFEHHGTIDKYIGDAILAVFGSVESEEQHLEAVRAALDMQAAMKNLNEKRENDGRVTCDLGIGIHCGEVFHGFIGAEERMEFTVIGDAVNFASRYCDQASAGEILVSRDLQLRVIDAVEFEARTIETKHEGKRPAFRICGLLPEGE